jgi:putative selenate reductase molybdopterin-binding subunit
MSAKGVTGHGTFAGDVRIPGMLHVRVVPSPVAHARLLRIDASAARALPGVVAVFTHEDVSRGAGAPGERVLLDDTARFVGDRVAVVAAEDAEVAVRAAEAVRVDYEALPALLDPEQALAADAPPVHARPDPANLAARLAVEIGEVDHALAEAERVFEFTCRVPRAAAAPVERHLAITWLDEDRRLVVRTSTESPFRVRETLAARLARLGITAARILVVQPQVGGGFGGKSDAIAEDLCALVTLRTGRPARLALSREEELTIAPGRPAQRASVRVGIRDRHLTALDLRVLLDGGAYPPSCEPLLRAVARAALAAYGVPALRFTGEAVFTHRPPTAALRGQVVLPALLALESQLDEIAEALDEDPVELRRRHLATAPQAARVAMALGDPPPADHFEGAEALLAGAAEIGWSRRWRASALAGPRRRGMGVALVRHPVVSERGAASLRVREDGSFNLIVGASASGTRAEAGFAAEAARVLGVPAERVVPASGNTDSAPFDHGAPAPTLHLTGQAVLKAAGLVREQLLAAGALHLGAKVESLVAEGGSVRARDGRSVSYATLAADALASPSPIAATSFHASDHAPPAGGACFAEVEVDGETGEVRVLRLVAVLEGGPLVDPELADSQARGDALRSAGAALVERVAFAPDGRALPRSFRDYPLATAVDAPPIEVLFVPASEPPTPFGTRPLGEVAAVAPAIAIANAVAHARGGRISDLPLVPERVRVRPSGETP